MFRRVLRDLLRNPGFTASVILTLALAITANLTVMSLLSGAILRKPSIKDPDRVVVALELNKSDALASGGVRPSRYVAWRSSPAFESSAVFRIDPAVLQSDKTSRRITVGRVSPEFFDLLGVAAARGKMFAGDDTQTRWIVLSDRLWLRQFGSDQSIIGRTVAIEGRAYTVAGVMPREFRVLPLDAEAWIPMRAEEWKSSRSSAPRLQMIARLNRDVTAARAEQQLTAISQSLPSDVNSPEAEFRARVLSLQNYIIETARIRPIVSFLLGAMLLVLLIACVNVAHLLFVRTSGKSVELALQLSLGANMRHLIRAAVYESLSIAVASVLVGLLLSLWSIHALQSRLTFNDYVSALDLRLDTPTLWFSAGIGVAVAIMLSAVPAFFMRSVPLDACLREQSRGIVSTRRKGRLGSALVMAQSAFASILLILTIAMLVKFWVAKQTASGFDSSGVLVARIELESPKFENSHSRSQFVNALLENLRAQVGVDSVAAASALPMLGGSSIHIDVGQHGNPWPAVKTRAITSGFFSTLKIPILHGTDFPERGTDSAHLVIVNQAFAKRFLKAPFLDQSVRLKEGNDSAAPISYRVVGVVGNTKHWLGEPGNVPEVYRMYSDIPSLGLTVAVRSHVNIASLHLHDAVHKLEPLQPVGAISTYRAALDAQEADEVLLNAILMFMAVLAIILAALGIYGVLSYSIHTRHREFGLRLALGSTPLGLANHVLRRSAVLAGIGVVFGLVLTPVLVRLLDSIFAGKVTHLGLIVLVVVTVELSSIMSATWAPAWRASHVDPVDLLRST
jgi:putative ABC transport system permease protein